MSATLTLVPTPLDEEGLLEEQARQLLARLVADNFDQLVLLVEDERNLRRKWLNWGLPREGIQRFRLLSEQTEEKVKQEILQELKRKENLHYVLLCEQGLPAFCDPGASLVDLFHQYRLKVSATPFPNSVALAYALSGFVGQSFYFAGFPPQKDEIKRTAFYQRLINFDEATLFMDTPYRLKKVMSELKELRGELQKRKKRIFIAMDLGGPHEELLRFDSWNEEKWPCLEEKREFVVVMK